MKAITYEDYGDPTVLNLAEVDTPKPASDEVLIRVIAAGVNPIDARMRAGELRGLLGGFPRVPGYDVAGIVEKAGGKCAHQEGDRVLAYLDHLYGGGYADFATCTHTSAVQIPTQMSFNEAAALPLAGCTALQSLLDYGKMKSGDRVLVLGASGGVGTFAVQIAKAKGATVTGVASGGNEEFVRSLGAAEFIDYEKSDYFSTNETWDVIFDVAGKSSFTEAREVLATEGHYVSTEPSISGLLVAIMTWPRSQQGTPMLARSRQKDLAELCTLYERNQLRVHIAEVFPLADAAKAHQLIENGGFCGKLLIRIADNS